ELAVTSGVVGEGEVVLFGGDTYINRYGFRQTAPLYVNDSFKSANKFQAVKTSWLFPVYSVCNIDLRHAGATVAESYYPKIGTPGNTGPYGDWIKRAADGPNSN